VDSARKPPRQGRGQRQIPDLCAALLYVRRVSPFALAVYFPLWAITVAVGFTALRLSRNESRGLVTLCLAQAVWITGIALLESGQFAEAERILPSGMLLAGASSQVAHELSNSRQRGWVRLAWGFGIAVSALGLFAPRLLYGPGAVGPGPLFAPLAVLSVIGTLLVHLHLLRLVRAAESPAERRTRAVILLSNVAGALGGGGAISLHVLRLSPAWVAAPFLLPSILLAAYAVWSSERGRSRDLVLQGFIHALATALLSSVALVVFAALLPALVPGGELRSRWAVLVAFCAALALDPLRQWLVERFLSGVFRDPIAVRDLAGRIEAAQQKADHAERLAEIGLLTSAVAHEVRNPLGVVLAETKLLERAGADPESVQTLREQVARASRFVDDLLRWSQPRNLAARELDALALARRAASLAQRAVEGSTAPEVMAARSAIELEADEHAVEDILVNLLRNALMAVAEGKGSVRLLVEEHAAEVRFIVEDDGPGVPRELEARLFQVFATGRGRDARHPGTGLGLATSLRLVTRHGGSLRHERPERGARFIASFPRRARIDV
jgi:signal transduction histidine kinase